MNRRHFLLAAPTLAAVPLLAAPVPKRKVGLGMLLIRHRQYKYALLSEDGKTEETIGEMGNDETKRKGFYICLSPDGRKIAWECNVNVHGKTKTRLCVRDFGGGWRR